MANFNKKKYDTEYAKNNYDRCIFNVVKGKKSVIEQHWKARGYKSLNAYVNDLIEKDMREHPTIPGVMEVKVASGRDLQNLKNIANIKK